MLNIFVYGLLVVALFSVFYLLFGGEYPEIRSVKAFILRIGLPFAFALTILIVTTPILMSPVSGMLLAILGWQIPGWIQEMVSFKRLKKNRDLAQNLATTAANLYGGGMVNEEVFNHLSERFPEPFKTEFKQMVTRRQLDSSTSFAEMLEEMADKYELPELRAKGKILSASKSGGSKSTAKGMKRLARALRLRNELISERIEATREPKIAVYIVLGIIGGGILLDVTYFREYFSQGGQMALAFSCLIFVVVAFVGFRSLRMNDIS